MDKLDNDNPTINKEKSILVVSSAPVALAFATLAPATASAPATAPTSAATARNSTSPQGKAAVASAVPASVESEENTTDCQINGATVSGAPTMVVAAAAPETGAPVPALATPVTIAEPATPTASAAIPPKSPSAQSDFAAQTPSAAPTYEQIDMLETLAPATPKSRKTFTDNERKLRKARNFQFSLSQNKWRSISSPAQGTPPSNTAGALWQGCTTTALRSSKNCI